MYELNRVEHITPDLVEDQRQIWLSSITSLPEMVSSAANGKLLRAALLERAMAGLAIDGFLMDQQQPISEYLFNSTRDQVRQLSRELS